MLRQIMSYNPDTMKFYPLLLISLIGTAAFAAEKNAATDRPITSSAERLGTVSFSASCAPAVEARFTRGVALLHDFWYQEAQHQFEGIAKADPNCAMAHWGVAMSLFHQIWDRPDDATVAHGWREMQAAQAHPAKTAREREYVAALSGFYKPDQRNYQSRIEDYAAAMAKLYQEYPRDTDAGAFYALSLLAAAQ
jgi:hypothetical protein